MSLEVMRSVNGRLEVVGGLDPFAQFDPEALTSEVETRNTSLLLIFPCLTKFGSDQSLFQNYRTNSKK